MEEETPKIWFENHLRKTLNSLYDPGVLQISPLLQLFNLTDQHNTASALRRLLTDVIESLRPTPSTPIDSQTWRVYQILRRRYVEQLTQQQVATNLGLSVRQLQRSEKLARKVLTDTLWSSCNLIETVGAVMHSNANGNTEDGKPPSMAEELAWLQDTVQAQAVSFGTVLNEVVDVLTPIIHESCIYTEINIEEDLPEIYIKIPLLRQALLNILNIAVNGAIQDNPIKIDVTHEARQLLVRIQAKLVASTDPTVSSDHTESLHMAQRLIDLCQGEFVITNTPPVKSPALEWGFDVTVSLPTRDSIDILVVDDNADVLQLFERYLAGSQYHFQGSQNSQQGLQIAAELQPAVVILDVMMPGQDGWTLLGQLREHPQTQDIPVVVCSILSQEEFAQSLGAVAFIRKPVNRQAFLEALDRQLAQQPKESG